MAIAGGTSFRDGWIGAAIPGGWANSANAAEVSTALRQGALLENAVFGFPGQPCWFESVQYGYQGLHQTADTTPEMMQQELDNQPFAEVQTEMALGEVEFGEDVNGFLKEILMWDRERDEKNCGQLDEELLESVLTASTEPISSLPTCNNITDPLCGSCAEEDLQVNRDEMLYPEDNPQLLHGGDGGDPAARSLDKSLGEQEQIGATLMQEDAKQDKETLAAVPVKRLESIAGKESKDLPKESIDPDSHLLLRVMLLECAKAVFEDDSDKALTILDELRKKASPFGDIHQRLAYYFSEGLSARITGTGYRLYAEMATDPPSGADMLKAFQLYGKRCASVRLSHFFCNQSILNACEKTKGVHIVDLGIGYGFHWLNLIQALALEPAGAPLLHITGIEDPRQFQEADTGRRLQEHARSCNLPLRYDAIRTTVDNFLPSDIAREEGELLVVNCLFALRHVPDENMSVDGMTGGRQALLSKLRSLRPSVLVYGDWSGSCNSPYFPTRFLEALSHYSALFEAVDASVPRTQVPRLTAEQQMWGREILNIVACEGNERVERQESYRRWHEVFASAGFEQIPLQTGVYDKAYSMLEDFPKNHVVARDADWLIHGWKERVLHAFSAWRPV